MVETIYLKWWISTAKIWWGMWGSSSLLNGGDNLPEVMDIHGKNLMGNVRFVEPPKWWRQFTWSDGYISNAKFWQEMIQVLKHCLPPCELWHTIGLTKKPTKWSYSRDFTRSCEVSWTHFTPPCSSQMLSPWPPGFYIPVMSNGRPWQQMWGSLSLAMGGHSLPDTTDMHGWRKCDIQSIVFPQLAGLYLTSG